MRDPSREHIRLFKCPRCKEEIDDTDPACWSCEFPLPEREEEDE